MTMLPRPTLLLMRRDAFVNNVIGLFTGEAVTHAGVGLGGAVVHAGGHGVVLEPRHDVLGRQRYELVAELDIVPRVALDRVLDQLGTPYDYGEIASRPLLRAARWLCPWLPWRAAPIRGTTCARLPLAMSPHGEIPEWSRLDPIAVTPGELAEASLGGPSFRRIR